MKHPLRLLFPIPVILFGIAVGVKAQEGERLSSEVSVPVTTTLAPAVVETTTLPTTVPATTTTTTEVTLPAGFAMPTLPPDVPCQEWAQVALDAGWPWELLPELLREVWNESRCQNVIPGHPQFNGHDHGPLQINEPTWHDEVQNFFGDWNLIDTPSVNFQWAWEMYKWYDSHGYCGFKPWSRRCQ